MQGYVNKYGQRVFINSPYIDQSETMRNTTIYSPNSYNLDQGLYSRGFGSCMRWVDAFHQYEKKNPRTVPIAQYDMSGDVKYYWRDRERHSQGIPWY
jgi:hypothetical protein